MRIAIFGAGAVGSLIGSELARAGQEVTLIGRGAHIEAVRANGLTVIMNGDRRHTRPQACTSPEEAGQQDLVILTLKGHQVPMAIPQLAPLLGPDTPVVAAQNGIPWWYFHAIGGSWEGRTLDAVDPGRKAWSGVELRRIVGCVINASCAVLEPGVVDHPSASRSLTLGEPDGRASPRVERIAAAFSGTDIKLNVTGDIRRAIWIKMMSNLGGSPLNVLTRTTIGQLAHDPGCQAVGARLIREMGQVAAALGTDITADIEARIKAAPGNSRHKTSMLQDLERGRPLEIDPIIGAVAEMGRMTGTPTPWIDAIYALVRLLARNSGCYPAE